VAPGGAPPRDGAAEIFVARRILALPTFKLLAPQGDRGTRMRKYIDIIWLSRLDRGRGGEASLIPRGAERIDVVDSTATLTVISEVWPGHPWLFYENLGKTWMAGTRPNMTIGAHC
jgi:hypothetical protein